MSEINKTDDPLMRMTQANDIYIDYLITQNAQSTATGCAELLGNQVKHDSFTEVTHFLISHIHVSFLNTFDNLLDSPQLKVCAS